MKYLLLLAVLLPGLFFAQNDKKVLLIGMDGTRSDALTVANTPIIDALKANGVWSPDALNDDITISGPGWSSNLCGVRSVKHLVTGNNFSGNDYATYPTIIKYIEDFDPNLHTASIVVWDPINNDIVLNDADFKQNVGNDAILASEAASYLTNNDPDFLFLHFDEIDGAGHSTGFSPTNPTYISKIEETDGLIGIVISALEARANYDQEDWLILLTSDHGGVGGSHGGTSIEHRNVTVIASGKSIPSEIIEKESTVIVIPNCMDVTTELTFDGDNDYVQIAPNSLFDFGSTQDFTVECRVRTTSPGDVAIVGNKNWQSGANKGFVFSFEFPNGPSWKVNIGDGSNRTDIDTGGEIGDGLWHTLSVSFDRDGMMKMYEDGIFLTESDISNIGDINTNQGLFFGTDFNLGFDFNGSIAEVRVWNTIVGASEISAWQCAKVVNSHPNFMNLIGYWRLDDETSLAEDLSGNLNDGVVVDATWSDTGSTVINDYSNTPRLVDIPYTALVHLCVPIQEGWGLDGQSLIAQAAADQLILNLKVLLEGAFESGIGLMNDNLRTGNLLSLEEPYTALGYSHINSGGETILPSVLVVTGNNAIVDWVFIELRDPADASIILETKVALIQRDGDVVALDGQSFLTFENVSAPNAYVVVKHRSHLAIRTEQLYSKACIHSIDLTNPNTLIFGSNSTNSISGKNVLVSGDSNGDGTVNTIDKNIYWRPENGEPLTYPLTLSDFNLDGSVNTVDLNLFWRINNSRAEQIE